MCWADQWCDYRLTRKILVFTECATAKASPAFVPVIDLIGVCKLPTSVATVVNDQIDARNWFNQTYSTPSFDIDRTIPVDNGISKGSRRVHDVKRCAIIRKGWSFCETGGESVDHPIFIDTESIWIGCKDDSAVCRDREVCKGVSGWATRCNNGERPAVQVGSVVAHVADFKEFSVR